MLVTTQWPLKRAVHLTSLVWVCVLWLPWKLNGAICAMRFLCVASLLSRHCNWLSLWILMLVFMFDKMKHVVFVFFLSWLHTQAHYTTPRHTTPHTTHHAIHTYIVVIFRDISISHFCYRLFSCHLVFHISRVSLYYIFFIDVAAWLSWNKAIAMECYKGKTEW